MSESVELTDDEYEIARRAVEQVLVEFRDGRLSVLGRGNGLVIAERDGTPSNVIRLGFEQALRVAVKAINEHREAT